MKILFGFSYYNYPIDVQLWNEAFLKRMRAYGYNVEGVCLTLNPPGGKLSWIELEKRWKLRDRELLDLYEKLERKLENFDVFVNYNGINLHPDFVRRLPSFNVYACFDDPESSEDLSKPVAAAYDLCLVGNIASVEMYKSWKVKEARFWPIGFRYEDYDPNLTYEQVLNVPRKIELTLTCERTSPWRRERLDKLATAFPGGMYFGDGWPGGFLKEEIRLPLLQQTQIGINIHNSTGPINFRTYYLPANGVMQICDNKSYLGKIFDLNKEVVGYDRIEDAIDLIRYFLAHPKEQREIAAAGWKRATTEYNERAIFQMMINYIEESIRSEKAMENDQV